MNLLTADKELSGSLEDTEASFIEMDSAPPQENGRALDLQKLETLQVLAFTCNFTRAAVELGYAQSTVTVHIKDLERKLGVRLFERSRFSKDVALTEAGRRAAEYAERLLALADEAERMVRGSEIQPRGEEHAAQALSLHR